MLAYFDVPLGWGELLKRTLNETRADNGLGLAAQLAYYFFLALFPALLFLISLASFMPTGDLVGQVIPLLRGVAPQQVIEILRDQLRQIGDSGQAGLLTFGVAAALWSSSAAMVALVDALNRAYGIEDARPWWRQRATAILLTIGVSIFILVSAALVLAGPQMAEFLGEQVGLGGTFEWTWKVLQWPLVFLLVATGVGLIYYFAPDAEQDFVWITPGSLVATTLWLVDSLGFRFYVVNFGSYNETYGTIGGVMVLMLWLYLSGLVIVVGAEMNAEIEHASPHGKQEGEKAPGERSVIGARAEREFQERQGGAPRRDPAGGVQPDVAREGGGMERYDQSIADVLQSTIRHARDLLRGEIALARAELRVELGHIRAAALLFAAAAVSAVIAVVFLLTAAAWAIAAGLDRHAVDQGAQRPPGGRGAAGVCAAMNGVLDEADRVLTRRVAPEVRDAWLIASAQRAGHVEIASYGTARSFAATLGHQQAAQLLQYTLEEKRWPTSG